MGGAAVPTLSSAVVTVLGLRVTRTQILRVSGLLAVRSLAGLIDIPLDDSVQAYLWTFMFSSAQAGVALATAASIFDFGGSASFISSIFPRAVDGPFLQLYARAVLLAGPVVALCEAAVVVFEVMSVARRLEQAMYDGEEKGAHWLRPALLCVCAVAVAGVMGVAVWSAHIAMSWSIGAAPVAAVTVALLLLSGATQDANVLEGCFIALYAAGVWAVAMVEEAALGGQLVSTLANSDTKAWAAGDDVRATILVASLLFLLLSMSRVERFAKVFAHGHDMVQEQEREQEMAKVDGGGGGGGGGGDGDGREDRLGNNGNGGDGGGDGGTRRRHKQQQRLRPVVSTVTLVAATFRVLMWAGQVERGEYLPVACRGWQLLMVVLLYGMYVRM